ncbi:hypothetical protein [Vibrio harveyi]|uniref:hypothetical protein n=1 Tax=Vibrio harveyi TaxID=669 RepID=UPI000DF1309C|nr:hypothetical protein [Vibrio harveyi]MCQ9084882.1 hypothetical protein [Vibrio harveyi]RCR63895.1 hypothetical protein DTW68_07545 [Vibrio harveyi]
MAGTPSPSSNGQILLHDKKLVQASCFLASHIVEEKRLEWSQSFAKAHLRGDISKLKPTSVFLVLSQNCDIACQNDALESCVELAICKKIRARDVHPGNSFVKSVRKLHFKLGNDYYEANVDYILTVDKADLLEIINTNDDFSLLKLESEYEISVPVWRANRYLRSALPDKFNAAFFPVLENHIRDIEAEAKTEGAEGYSSFIRAIYIWLNSDEELDSYNFDIFALLRDETSDDKVSSIQDKIEDLAEELTNSAGYTDESDVYAGTESTVTVAYLTKFVRLNLDYLSLAQSDSDTGQTLD